MNLICLSRKGRKMTDKKIGPHEAQYIQMDGTNKAIYEKST